MPSFPRNLRAWLHGSGTFDNSAVDSDKIFIKTDTTLKESVMMLEVSD